MAAQSIQATSKWPLGKHPGGRPTKYRPALAQSIDAYLSTTGNKTKRIPTKYGFSQFLGINGDTLVEWEKKYPEFSACIKKLQAAQVDTILSDGFYGGKDINAAMGIFWLKAQHGMVETQHIQHSGDINFTLQIGNDYLPTGRATTPAPAGSTSSTALSNGQPIQDADLA